MTKTLIEFILKNYSRNCMTNMRPSKTNLLVRNPDVVLREVDPDSALLFNPDTNQIREINSTGLFIWKQCDGRKGLPEIIAAMKKFFEEVPVADVESQVKLFLDDMQSNGFIGSVSKNQ